MILISQFSNSLLFASKSQNIQLSTTEISLNLVKISDENLMGTMTLSNLDISEKMTENGLFTQIAIPGYHRNQTVGTPQLPMMNKIIDIPPDADIHINIINMETKNISLKDLGYENVIYPVQTPVSKSPTAVIPPFEQNLSVYSIDNYYQPASSVEIEKIGKMRSKELALLKISPLSYNPVKKTLKIITLLEFEITYIQKKTSTTLSQKALSSPSFDKLYSKFLETELKLTTNIPEKYIIICPEDLLTTLEPFILWKIQMGYDVDVQIYETLGSKEAVRSYIQQAYFTADENHPAPEFVLLVGDHPLVPAFTSSVGSYSHLTDLPYGEMHDDFLPDIFIGRFPVNTEAELEAIIHKTLLYEKGLFENPEYLNDVTLIAGWDYNATYKFHLSHGIPTIEYGKNTYFNPGWSYSLVNYYEALENNTVSGSEVMTSINTGVGFVNYTGHGTEFSWYNPAVSIPMIHTMTNIGRYPLVITNGCETSDFKQTECFGEAWIRQNNSGAMAYIGATNSTYWDEDVYWSVGNFGHVGDGETISYEESGLGAYDAPFHTDTLINQSALIKAGNLAVQASGSYLSDYYWEVYELFGDPALINYWSEPEVLTANYPKSETLGIADLTITVNSQTSIKAALSLDEELLAVACSDENGMINLTFSEPISVAGDYILVLSGQNYLPIIDIIKIISPSIVSFSRDTLTIMESAQLDINVLDTNSNPISNVTIWAESPGWSSDSVVTNPSGIASMTFLPLYGPEIKLIGKRNGDSYNLFEKYFPVINGMNFTNTDISVWTDFGLADTFSVDLPGNIRVQSDSKNDIRLLVKLNNDDTIEADSSDYTFTPNSIGKISCQLLLEGYNNFEKSFPVIRATSSLSGQTFNDSLETLSNILVKGFIDNQEVFSEITDSLGHFSVSHKIPVGELALHIDEFAYDEFRDTVFINYPQDSIHIMLGRSENIIFNGIIRNEFGDFVKADIKIYPIEEDFTVTEGYSDSSNGEFSFLLPDYTYRIDISSPGYLTHTFDFFLTNSSTINITLESISGILIIDGQDGKSYVDKSHTEIRPKIKTSPGLADDIFNLLNNEGLKSHIENLTDTDLSYWSYYDAIVLSTGNSEDKLPPLIVESLLNFVSNNGRLFIEGGELAWNYENDTHFISDILHITDWLSDGDAGALKDTNTFTHPLNFNLPEYIGHSYTDDVFGDQDAVVAALDCDIVRIWADTIGASLIAYDSSLVFFPFNFANIDSQSHKDILLENVISYLGFTINSKSNPPLSFSLLSPTNDETWDLSMSPTFELNWENSKNPYGADLTYTLFLEYKNDIQTFHSDSNYIEIRAEDITFPRDIDINWYVSASDGYYDIYSNDVFRLTIQNEATAIVDNTIPKEFVLNQNYPNPFNPTTTISYGLPEQSSIQLSIYNILGERVFYKTINRQSAGWHKYIWNATNNSGAKVSAGIYFLRMDFKNQTGTTKQEFIKFIYLK